VARRRQGKWRYYRLAQDADGVAARALAWVLDELRADPQLKQDARRIRTVRRQDLTELAACYRS
jgi:hypothetical protein